MAKNFWMIATILLLVLGAGWIVLENSIIQNKNLENYGNKEYQRVVIGIKDYNYYPNEIKVKAGIPVRIYLDESVVGCFRSFTIRDLGIQKYLATSSDYVEFTPKEKGTHVFACSMGMGTGRLIVE